MLNITPPFNYESFAEFVSKCGLSRESVSLICSRSASTVDKWYSADNAPPWVYLVVYCAAGFVLCSEFCGFRFIDGQLYTGTRITRNRGFAASEITQYDFMLAYMTDLENECLRLRSITDTNVHFLPLKRSFKNA